MPVSNPDCSSVATDPSRKYQDQLPDIENWTPAELILACRDLAAAADQHLAEKSAAIHLLRETVKLGKQAQRLASEKKRAFLVGANGMNLAAEMVGSKNTAHRQEQYRIVSDLLNEQAAIEDPAIAWPQV